MGQCGCGEINPVAAYKIGDGYLVVSQYWGCDGCNEGPSVDLCYFDEAGFKDFGNDLEPVEVEPDRYGGSAGGIGWFPQVGKSELVKAVEELSKHEAGQEPISEYGQLKDWMSDNGLRLVQAGMKFRNKPWGSFTKPLPDTE